MKCICVAGVSQPDLEYVLDILKQSGMASELSVEKQQAMDMDSWHQHVVDMIDDEVDLQGIVNPGRFMEQMASDIFLANINAPLWGFADTRSTLLLDFWQHYDPRVYFVLVCVSPEQLLANAMCSQDEKVSVESVMVQWQQYHQQLLRFHLRNPQRSVLVSASDCIEHPALFISHLSKQWKIKTKSPRVFASQTSSPKKSYLLFLAQQLCADEVQIQSLQNELSATRLYLDGSLKSQQDLCVYSTEEVLASYVLEQQKLKSIEINSKNKIDEFERKNDILNNEIIVLTQAYNEKESLIADQQTQINHLIETNTQNSELLLLELHQAHQESENYFVLYQEKENALKQAQVRWARMLERSPDYFDYDSLNVNITHNGKHKHVSDWTLKNINAAGRTIDAFGFSFEVSKHHTAICFTKLVDGMACFTKWPASLADQSVFKMTFNHNGSAAQQDVDVLQALGTSDWRFLGVLAHWLKTTLSNTESANLPRDLPLDALRFGVNQFILLSSQLNSTLRYDHVSLKREQTNPDYEHLWLKLANVVFEDQHASDFEFRLSCANVRPNAFGGYPKLEFPQEVAQPCFDSWFEESYDDFGAKLELRFALPDAMDTGIWGKLSAHDQALVVQIIEQLPIILRELVQSGASMKRSLNDWLRMAQSIEDIFAMRVLPVELEVVESIDLLALNLYDD